MDDNLKDVPDFDDLLFETRNKEYGAYQLRKSYNSVLTAGIILASLIVSTSVLLPFILIPHSNHVLNGGNRYVQVQMENFDPPAEELIIPPAPPPEVASIQEVIKYVPPVVVDTMLTLENTMATTDEVLFQSTGDQVDVTGSSNNGDVLTGQEGNELGEAFFVVEVMPSFKGGDISKFREWVSKRMYYPQEAADKKIRGTVFLTFIVEKDGSVSNVTVIKGVDPLLDHEAVKTISESPKWTPGLQRGQPVSVRYSIPLTFMY